MTPFPRQLSYIELRGGKDIESVDLVLANRQISIPRQGEGSFSEHFDERLPFAADLLALEVRRRKKLFFRSSSIAVSETITISSADIQSGSERQVIKKRRGKVDITLEVSPPPIPTDTAPRNLTPTTEDLINQCPRF